MDFIVNLETTKDYEPIDVVETIQAALNIGFKQLKLADGKARSKIADDLFSNCIITERV